ncbi:hypothetical protein GGQ80_001177 [Sphingomonas jinjuensis]|uniref:Uncharacterized protein n=1 Tax=Sphingomonas jinjuensis TaxID=535907 RepID=A0A840FIV4_9SPHN|nr:hypothetical protein [Sphingomonas jinjuensis]MBB4153275.1 hypothetical protein [Sphingomonas jinjuensis]
MRVQASQLSGFLAMVAMIVPASTGLAAQRRDTKASAALDALAQCVAIATDAERLACYDRAARPLIEAQKAKDFVVVDREEVRKTKRSLFGFSLPSIKLFGASDDEPVKQLVGVMTESTQLPGGLMRFQLDDGSVWDTTEGLPLMPRKGDTVTVKAGSLGSYIATAPGRRSPRVKRVR